jgi:hypothetical protein
VPDMEDVTAMLSFNMTTVSRASGGRAAVPWGPRDASGCELSLGLSPKKEGWWS